MSFRLVLIGNKYATDADETVDWHLEPGHHAFWTNVQHPSRARGTRLWLRSSGWVFSGSRARSTA